MSINVFPGGDVFEINRTAFGELRVAELTPKVQLNFPYNINLRLVKDLSGGGGTLTQVSGLAVCSSSASTNASGVLQSRRFLKYDPGEGALVRFTALFTPGVVGSSQEIGIGDGLDGYFFGYDGTSFGIMRRRDGVDNWTPQSSWNIDTMPDIDVTLGNVYQINYQWLGFGQILFAIEDPVNGSFRPVHAIKYTNTELVPSILNPSLPMYIFAGNTTNNTDVVVKTSSMGAFVEGNEVGLGFLNASGVAKSQGTTVLPVISFRNNLTFQGQRNRTVVQILRAFVSNEGNQGVEFEVFLNPTLTDASFNDVDSSTSVISIDISATTFTGGFEIINSLVGSNSSDTFSIEDLNVELDPGDIILIAAHRLSGSSADIDAGLVWRERP